MAERRIALVIGNSAYKNVTPLPNPAHDAAAIAAMLKKAGFDVVLSKTDLGNVHMRRTLRAFARKAVHADIAVVYYAGHGIEVDGINYLIPIDAKLASDFDVEDETISLNRIVRILEPVRRLRLIILDACRENPFTRTMTRTIATRSIGRGLAKVEVTTTDTLIAFAAKAGMTAADGNGAHSPYTAALLDNLTVPGLDLRIALGRVRDAVMKSTGERQEPYYYGSIGGSTVALVPKPKVPRVVAKPQPSADVLAHDDYEFAERVGTREAWDYFLEKHKSGFYAKLARAARDKIVAAEMRQEPPGGTEQGAAQAKQAPIVVANAPSTAPDSNKRNVASAIGRADIARLLQLHLKRVGCDPGAVDGQWTEQTVRALRDFNKHAHARLDTKVASLNALEIVKQHKFRVCPLQCRKGYKAEGDRCVAIACQRGYVRNRHGDCERKTRKARARPAMQHKGGGNQAPCDERIFAFCRQ